MTSEKTITKHLLTIYSVLKSSTKQWMSTEEIAEKAQVSSMTVCRKTKYLVEHGVLDKLILFPTHLYKLSEKAESIELVGELEKLIETFNI